MDSLYHLPCSRPGYRRGDDGLFERESSRDSQIDLGIVLVSWNVRDLLAACLASAFAEIERSRLASGVWVVDNHSADGSPAMVSARFPETHLILNDGNAGFAAANNQALRAMGFGQSQVVSRPPVVSGQSSVASHPAQAAVASPPDLPFAVLLLNPDTEVKSGALATLVEFMRATPLAGVAGARLTNPDGTPQECAFDFPGLWQAALDLFPPPGGLARLTQTRLNGRYPRRRFERGAPFRIGHPLGAAFMARGEAIAQVGLMDEGYHIYCEEIDWAWRMQRAGWEAYCVPRAEVIHYGGHSTAQVEDESYVNLWRSRRRLYEAHRGRLTAGLVGVLVRAAMKRRARYAGAVSQATYAEVAGLWR